MTQPTICRGCGKLATHKGQCDECRQIPTFRTKKKRPYKRRPRKNYYEADNDDRMIKLRKAYMSKQLYCAAHLLSGEYIPAEDMDHILPISKAPDLKYEESNWQPLCKSCHSWKTTQETYQGIAYDFIRVKKHDLIGR